MQMVVAIVWGEVSTSIREMYIVKQLFGISLLF